MVVFPPRFKYKIETPFRSGYHHRRSASPRLPAVKGSSREAQESAVGSLLASSLSSLTLGSFGLGNSSSSDHVRARKSKTKSFRVFFHFSSLFLPGAT
jgi:hypothetical protein